MNTDFRITTTFIKHPKTRALRKNLGPKAVDYLLNLWTLIATQFPEGEIIGMTDQEIASEIGYRGSNQRLFDALTFVPTRYKVGFFVRASYGLCAHDWQEHNGYASAACKRQRAAADAAKTRWDRKLGRHGDNGKARNNDAPADASADAGALPEHDAPSPSPSPKPNPTPTAKGDRQYSDEADNKILRTEISTLVDQFKATCGWQGSTKFVYEAIRDLLDNYSTGDISGAISRADRGDKPWHIADILTGKAKPKYVDPYRNCPTLAEMQAKGILRKT